MKLIQVVESYWEFDGRGTRGRVVGRQSSLGVSANLNQLRR